MPKKECLFYKCLKNGLVKCLACNHYCIIKKGNVGICKIRKNIDNKLYLLNYSKIVCENIDNIEKKPLFHFFPNSLSYSIGSIGCNFKCSFCQNYDISFESNINLGKKVSPKSIVNKAIRTGCKSISYTYNEPVISIEFYLEIMKLAKRKGLKNVLVTNGYISQEVLEKISPLVDAMNIDLKSFNEDFYKKICKAKLKPVLNTIKLANKLNIWIEISTLIIPNENDSLKEIENVSKFIENVDKNIPLHLLRYFPSFKMKKAPTSIFKMKELLKVCKKYLFNVYLGNINEFNNTICSFCKKEVIKRSDDLIIVNMNQNKCAFCDKKIKGVF